MISELEEETLDLDWFAVDEVGNIAHFTTGGRGFIPYSVKVCDPIEVLMTYVLSDLSDCSDVLITDRRTHQSQSARDNYLHDFVQIAKKGIYSYDGEVVGRRPCGYFAVAMPVVPIQIGDLSLEIQAILNQTRYPGVFRDSRTIAQDAIA